MQTQDRLFSDEPTFSVGELNQSIGLALGRAFPDEVWVRGEIANLSRPASGHVYFDLVGDGCAIGVTLWETDKQVVNAVLRRAGGAVRMNDGTEVRLRGRVSWWAERGKVALRMLSIDTAYTLGRLAEARELLVQRLRQDGSLSRQQALALPLVPLRVGLVTSAGSAAAADFLHTLTSSGFGFSVVMADSRVQGLDAERSMLQALDALARLETAVDVVCIVRGGGARTDLACFDSEALARAISEQPVPVLTGIGHEIDSTVADLVAHEAFKTPTACAAALVERVGGFRAALDERAARLHRLSHHALERSAARLSRAAERTAAAGRSQLRAAAGRVERCELRAAALDPARALARGWSITRDESARVVRSIVDAPAGARIVTTLSDGVIRSTVDE